MGGEFLEGEFFWGLFCWKKLPSKISTQEFGSKIRASKICFPEFGPTFGFRRCKSPRCRNLSLRECSYHGVGSFYLINTEKLQIGIGIGRFSTGVYAVHHGNRSNKSMIPLNWHGLGSLNNSLRCSLHFTSSNNASTIFNQLCTQSIDG